MGFLRRLTGRDARGAPDWCSALGGDGYRLMVEIVARQLGSRDMPGSPAEVWWPRETAEALALPRLAASLARLPRAQWEAAIRAFYGPRVAKREAGDRAEAAARTLDLAAPMLRLILMPEASAPPGDVRFPGPLPGTVEVLALDARVSDRFVSERLAASWGEPLERARAVAEGQVLALPIDEADRAEVGRPAVRSYRLDRHGAYIGPIVRHLAERLPDAVGPFGAYVGVPTPGGLIVRPLAAGIDLRGDLGEVALLCQAVWEKSAPRLERVPFWVRPDGKIVPGTLRFDETGATGSSMPGLAGVLAALDPRELLPVAGWAQGKLSVDEYVRFAGCVSAALGHTMPEDVAQLGSALNLGALAHACAAAPQSAWPGMAFEHVGRTQGTSAAWSRLHAEGALEALLDGLVTWLDTRSAEGSARVDRPVAGTAFVEVLGLIVEGHAAPLDEARARALGPKDELFERGRAAVRRSLVVKPAADLLSGPSFVLTGQPSSSSAIPHLLTWLPEVTGPYGALVAVGSAGHLNVLPIHDASVVLDLPGLLGLAIGANITADWPLLPTVVWLSAEGLETVSVEVVDGEIAATHVSSDLVRLVARLPAEPRRLPPGLEAILGREGSRRFYGMLHAEYLDRMLRDMADVAELGIPNIREIADGCRPLPAALWPSEISAYLEGMAAPRRVLDHVATSRDYAQVGPYLDLRVARSAIAGSQLARDVGGGLALFPIIRSGRRHRRVTFQMLERWGIDADRCHDDAALRSATAADLVDEQMYPDQPSVRRLYAQGVENEAAGLVLHIRYPGTRHGFIVSITHGSRAHYIRLDDPGAMALVPVFAHEIARIYAAADAAADAHSPWLYWVAPDGRVVPLFDVRGSLPAQPQLPPELQALLAGHRQRWN